MLKTVEKILARFGDPSKALSGAEAECVERELAAISRARLASVARNPSLVNIMGLPASGKTTAARQWLASDPERVYIAFDEIMESLSLYRRDFSVNRRTAFLRWEGSARAAGYRMLSDAVERGLPVLFEHSNALAEHIDLYREIAAAGYRVEIRHIAVGVDTVRRRLEKRERFFPPDRLAKREQLTKSMLDAYTQLNGVRFMTISPDTRPRTLVIVRHGNTFKSGETPTRVGARTDLPLVEEDRAKKAACFLDGLGVRPNRVFAAPLRRTRETARIIAREMGLPDDIAPADRFVEIDYGPDENKTEDEVWLRLGGDCLAAETGTAAAAEAAARERGERAIREWDEKGTPPTGWLVDVAAVKRNWREFADGIGPGETALLVSSNGIIRFAPCLLQEGYDAFRARERIKVSTGGVCVFVDDGLGWKCTAWNSRPVQPV